MPSDLPLQQALSAIGADRDPQSRQRHGRNISELLQRMAQFGNRRDDPVRMIQGYLGDRWSSLVMHLLSGGMLRHTELRRLIRVVSAEHDISQRVLTLKLRVLERDGLVARTVTYDVPPRVEYRLTELGETAYGHFAALVRWAEQATPAIREARHDHDQRHPDSAALIAGLEDGEAA